MNNYNNSNNASTTISAWISASATTLLVDNGAILPNAPFLLTLEHIDNEKVTVREIVKCTAKIGNALTIVRSAGTCVQDDTATPKVQNNTPHSFWVGDFASIYWTSEQVKDIQDEIEKKLDISDFQAWTYVYGATSGGTDTYEITLPWTITSYQLGQVFRFMADTWNEWNAYLNVNSLGALEIFKNHDKHLETGDIEAGQIVVVAYDWTAFQMNSEVAQVVELSDINSLNYKDTTCYAWEEIHSNDLIVTNWNSFDPSRTDESTDVWGATVNKYAIWFIGNGEKTDTFSVKTSVIEWFEPNSVTINIESDDNWKPSWTALATSTSLNVFKIRTDPNSITTSSISWLNAWYMNTLWKGEGKIAFTQSTKEMTVSWNLYNYTLDFSSLLTESYVDFGSKTSDDKYFMFWTSNNYNKFWLVHLPNPKTIEGATVQTIDASIINTASWVTNARLYDLCITDNWKYMFAGIMSWSWSNTNIFKITLTTPFVVNSYDDVTGQTIWSAYYRSYLSIIKNFWKEYLCWVRSTSPQYVMLWELDTDYTITNYYSSWAFANTQIHPDYREFPTRFYWGNNELLFWYTRNYDWIYKGIITTTSVLNTVKGTKYRLTIAPVVTWSIVDSVKIHEKEWEYFSTCMVKDTDISHDWSTVANKTPYIDSSCIKARYARKVNDNDTIWNIGWFAIWDFTEFETVSYCFKGALGWFQNLDPDTIYFSDSEWWIWTVWDIEVGKSVDWWKLIVNIKNSINPSLKDSNFTFTVPSSSTSTETKTFYASRNEIAFVIYKGIWTIKVNWQLVKNFSNTADIYFNLMLYKKDYVEITLARYDSSNGWSVRFNF